MDIDRYLPQSLQRFRASSALKPTLWLGLTLIAYLGAVLRNEYFPWLLASLMLATVVSGWLLPHALVRKISVRRESPIGASKTTNIDNTAHAHENQYWQCWVEVHNQGLMPRFMIEVVDYFTPTSTQSAEVFDPTQSQEKKMGIIPYLPMKSRRRLGLRIFCEKRGRYRIGPVGLLSSFPLGMTEVRQTRDSATQTLIVYPRLFPIINLPLTGVNSEIHRGGYVLPKNGGSVEFSGLREYRRGDNPRHIHWASTAKAQTLMVREFEPLASARIHLVLDQSIAGNMGSGQKSSFEYAVRIAGSMAKWACDQGIVCALSGQTFTVSGHTGVLHFKDIFEALAVVNSDAHSPLGQVISSLGELVAFGETVVVFLTPHVMDHNEMIQALSLIRARGANVLAVVFAEEGFVPCPSEENRSILLQFTSELMEWGVQVIAINGNDDLTARFNP